MDNESEILLGNKQLLVVFAVMALLLAVAFTGGYMLGKRSSEKNSSAAQTAADGSSALVTRSVSPDDQGTAKPEASDSTTSAPATSAPAETSEPIKAAKTEPAPPHAQAETPKPKAKRPEPVAEVKPAHSDDLSLPKPGQTYVQVAALTRPQAEATADVLRKQNFAARIAPKPGSTTVFRVLVGPAADASEITATRDALRKIGFRDVIIQRY